MSRENGSKPDKQKASSSSPVKDFFKKNKDSVKDFIEIIIFLGLAVLLVFSFNWILGAILHTDTPLVVVTSESMEPTYFGSRRVEFGGENDIRKDMLIVRGVDPSEIGLGDTIVFYRVNVSDPTELDLINEPIVHRVNRIYYDNATDTYWFTTKGDNPDSNDDFLDEWPDVLEHRIHEDRVIGKIIGRIGYLGGIISYFQTLTGRIILVVSVAVILLATFIFGSFGEKKKDDDVFEDETEEKVKEMEGKDLSEEPSFWAKLKKGWQKMMKKKHIVFPALILGIIIFIPIVDSLAAQWGTPYGVTDVSVDAVNNAETLSLVGGDETFIYVDVTLSCPGHWQQQFKSFDLQIYNYTSGQFIGNNTWTIVYNFEGSLTVNSGAWVNATYLTEGLEYTVIVTANLSNKFGKTWTDVLATNFTLGMRP